MILTPLSISHTSSSLPTSSPPFLRPFFCPLFKVGMVEYFRCKPNHGTFVRRSRLQLAPSDACTPSSSRASSPTPSSQSRPQSRRRTAPFTAPTFRVQRSVRPDKGFSNELDRYAYSRKRSPSPEDDAASDVVRVCGCVDLCVIYHRV